ncbi:MAG: YicC family protein [Clostridiales bacterium]|nr:YicC family protein [Clostridiales bacterium]
MIEPVRRAIGQKEEKPMLSMTGYGKGEYVEGGLELTCEIKTVNNRYLDVSIKAPRVFACLEDVIRNTVRKKLTRGHADVFISLKDKRERPTALALDMALAGSYVAAAKAMKEAFPDLTDDITLSSVLRYPDVMKQEDSQSLDEEMTKALDVALEAALCKLNEMRAIEGEKLREDMLARVATIETLVEEISLRAPEIANEYREKLTARVKEYLNGANIDENRILTEVAVFTDKSNIDEELTRLRSHIEQFRSICQEGIVGRKLDFLVQEFNREANTTCSKSNDVAITRAGLVLKNEIEKIREQVQNLE